MPSVLSGDLRAFPLSDILLLLNGNRKTGTLRVTHLEITKSLEWDGGEIVFARSSEPRDWLGAWLVSRGKVSSDRLAEATGRMSGQERLGRTLVRLGTLSPSAMWDAVRGQVTEIVYSLFEWKDGRFDFVEHEPPRERIHLDHSVMNLILEGSRRQDEWSQIRERIPGDHLVVVPLPLAEGTASLPGLSDVERRVLDRVDGRRTVREIVETVAHGEFETWQALHGLMSAGLVRAHEPAGGAPPVSRPAGPSEEDRALEATLDRYGMAVEEILARARQAGGAEELARLRRRLREATLERADLLRDLAIQPDGSIDRRTLLANAAEDPPGEREPNLRAALDSVVDLLGRELEGRVRVEDVLESLGPR